MGEEIAARKKFLPADDWIIQQALEKVFFGQTRGLYLFVSKKAACSAQIYFSDVKIGSGSTWENLKGLKGLYDAAIGVAKGGVSAIQGLVGTSVLIKTEGTPVKCARSFSINELDGAEVTVTGGNVGAGFGYEKVKLSTKGLFEVSLSGATAGVMFPWLYSGIFKSTTPILGDFPVFGTLSGSWKVLEAAFTSVDARKA